MTTATHSIVTPCPANPRPANERAQALTGRPYLSFSQISQMRACPKRFEFHYLQKARPDYVASSLLFGQAVHAAVETFLRVEQAGTCLSADDLHQAFRQAWKEGIAMQVLTVKYPEHQTEAALDVLGGRMLKSFLASAAATPAGKILSIEEERLTQISGDLPDVQARVDLVYETRDALVIRDFKTSRSRWNQEKAAESADQLLLYGRCLQDLSRELLKPVRGEFVVLTKTKVPMVQTLGVPLTPQVVQRTLDAIASTWSAMLAGNFYPAPSPMNCGTCQYKSRCPVFQRT